MGNVNFGIQDGDKELKQHLNLSDLAWDIVNNDIKVFYDEEEKESLSGFLNRVFANFYQDADATISIRLYNRQEELEKRYSTKEFSEIDDETKNLFIEKDLMVYEKELVEKAFSYEKSRGEKFRINYNNLNEILKDSNDAKYYRGAIGAYFKAVIEEYASKPSYIREQIFFKNVVDEIRLAIKEKKKLRISLTKKKTVKGDKTYVQKFYFTPYRIVQDDTKSFNYLVGYSEKIVEYTYEEEGKAYKASKTLEKTIACNRICRIDHISMMSSMGGYISKEKSQEIENALKTRTPMYMTSDLTDVVVRFTEKGLESFRRQILLRPSKYTIDSKDNRLYTFKCTEVQAINYFFKFGWDAEIIEPVSLRENFIRRYENALKAYSGISKDEIISKTIAKKDE